MNTTNKEVKLTGRALYQPGSSDHPEPRFLVDIVRPSLSLTRFYICRRVGTGERLVCHDSRLEVIPNEPPPPPDVVIDENPHLPEEYRKKLDEVREKGPTQ